MALGHVEIDVKNEALKDRGDIVEKKLYTIHSSWRVWATEQVVATSLEEAERIVCEGALPTETTYAEESFQLDRDVPDYGCHTIVEVQEAQTVDIEFPCCLYDDPRTLDWCEKNCPSYYHCDTVAMAIDELKEREGEA